MRSTSLVVSVMLLTLLMTPILKTSPKPMIPGREKFVRFGSPSLDEPVSIRVGPDGEIYVYGLTEAFKYDLQSQAFLIRLDGSITWQLIFGSKFSEVPVDAYVSAGKLYVTGVVEAPCPYSYLIVLDRSGNVEWSSSLRSEECSLEVKAAHVYAGQIYLAGKYGEDGFVARIERDKVHWIKVLDFVPQTILYSMGYVYASGNVDGKVIVLKMIADSGRLMWAVKLGGKQKIKVNDLAFSNSLFLVGDYGPHGLIISLSPIGELNWAKYLESAGSIKSVTTSPLRVIGNSVDGKCWISQFEDDGSPDWYGSWGTPDCKALQVKAGYAYVVASGSLDHVSGKSFFIKPLNPGIGVKPTEVKLKDGKLSFSELKFEYRNRGMDRAGGKDVLILKLKVNMYKASDFCSLSFNEFPHNFRYFAVSVDEDMNRRELSSFTGPGKKEDGYVVVLGGPMINKEITWESYGIKFFVRGGHYVGFTFRGKDYVADYGKKDYAIIIYDCESMRVWVAGITRYGTRAGLLWLLSNPDYVAEKGLVLVRWEGTGEVREDNVIKVYP